MNEHKVSRTGNGSPAASKSNAIQDGIAHAPGGGDALLRLDDVVMLVLDHHPGQRTIKAVARIRIPERNRQMAQTQHSKRSEKGLLTPDNCMVAFIDHQPQMLFGTSNFDRQSIINNTVALAKATRIFDVPVVLTTVETKSFSGNMWPQLKAIFPGREPIERSSMNSWDDKNFIAAIERTGRKKIVLCGLWTETCVALPTVQAIHDGYEIFVVEDCCGDVNQLSHDNAMRRTFQAGAKPVTALSTVLEWQR